MKHPNPTRHLYVSLVKSVLRVAAGSALCFGLFVSSGVLFILAEACGIIEELV